MLCILTYVGRGYSPAFPENYDKAIGRLVAGEGITLFLAGPEAGIDAFYAALREDPRFADLRVKTSYSRMRPFARLKAKVKPEIISFRIDDGQPPIRGRRRWTRPRCSAGCARATTTPANPW